MNFVQESSKPKVSVLVEIRISGSSRARKEVIKTTAEHLLTRITMFRPGTDRFLLEELGKQFGVNHVWISIPPSVTAGEIPYFLCSLEVFVYRANELLPVNETSPNEHDGTRTTLFSHRVLPSQQFEGIWENLILEDGVKERLLNYSSTSLLFSEKHVDPNQVCCNRIFLFYGSPGTGKTSLCQALAQKLAIRKAKRYPKGFHALEVNAHALFSRFFSESGKLVNKMFESIRDLAQEKECLVIVLIDEVESLTGSRDKNSSADPSDAIRVVNAMLTQIDRLRTYTNVMIFATSNVTDKIDGAFLDRADVKLFMGNPDVHARLRILQSCLSALISAGVVSMSASPADSTLTNEYLWKAAVSAQGLSGRALRKLPFQAHAFFIKDGTIATSYQMAEAFFLCIEEMNAKRILPA